MGTLTVREDAAAPRLTVTNRAHWNKMLPVRVYTLKE